MQRTDAELMALVAEGDGEMLGVLYHRHGRMVWAMLRRWFRKLPVEDVNDLVQEVFIDIGRSAVGYRDQDKFKAWLLTIAYRKAKHFERKEGLRRSIGFAGEPVSSEDVPDRRIKQDAQAEMKEVLSQMMNRLPGELREVLWLKVSQGFVSREIAEMTGVQENTVRTRLHRARQMLMNSADAVTWRKVLTGGRP